MISYDYEEFLQEMHEELAEGILRKDSTIQVLRKEEAIVGDYYPIIDWYYDHKTTVEDRDGVSDKEWAQYILDRKRLIAMTVEEFVEEMEGWNKLI